MEWAILILGFLLAGMGTVIPGLPGSIFVVIAVVAHKYLRPDVFSWWTVGFVAVLAILSSIVDIMGGIWGAKLGGATRSGLIGAAIGGLIGFTFGIPGLILGPFLGAICGDIYAKRRNYMELLRSGAGAATGFLISLIARFALLLAQALVVIIALVWHKL